MPLKNCFGMHGWKEFHRNRKDILAEYDRILELTENRPVKTAHGEGVEAYWRKWLSQFIPQKWAVTSGYIIPTLYRDNKKLYHYDVIIYDAINSPTLWTEGNEDDSSQGKYRAIPAQHVLCVMEIKSRLNTKSVKEMAIKLSEVNEFSGQLPSSFFSAGLFIQLQQSDNEKMSILRETHKLRGAYKFSEAMVLRYENDDTITGTISHHKLDCDESKNGNFKMLAKPIDELNIFMSEDGNIRIAESGGGVIAIATDNSSWAMTKTIDAMHQKGEWSANITWSRSGFSNFCIDLISCLEGLTFNDENRPSFGRIFDKFERRPDCVQSNEKVEGRPHIILSLEESEDKEIIEITENDDSFSISFTMNLQNIGDTEAICSDDHFANQISILPGKKAMKRITIKAFPDDKKKGKKGISNKLNNEGLLINLPIAYHLPGDKNKFYGIFKAIRVFIGKAAIEENKEMADKVLHRTPTSGAGEL